MKCYPTALITGASSGIGLHLAHEFASHGHRLVLVAPDPSELANISGRLTTSHGIDVRIIAADLENAEAPQEIYDQLRLSGWDIDILVNDAGKGQTGLFAEIPLEQQISILRLNVEALVRLTHLFLQPMLHRRSGRILNVASIAGFEPGPRLALYHATKALVLSLSEALATELEDTGITVTTLCPGPTDTDFFPKAHMLKTRAFQQAKIMSPQEVARAGYEALSKGERLIVPGAASKALVFKRRFLPLAAQAKMNQKMSEEVDPGEQKRHRGDQEFAPGRARPSARLTARPARPPRRVSGGRGRTPARSPLRQQGRG